MVFRTSVACLICAFLSVLAPSAAWATVQEQDAVRYEGQDAWLAECPLNAFWWNRDLALPDFDEDSTSNRKGYTARWEIKDSKLYLVSFEAQLKRKPVDIEDVLSGRKLPVFANWYSGQIQVLIGEPAILGDGTYPRIAILQMRKGRVVASEEKRNSHISRP